MALPTLFLTLHGSNASTGYVPQTFPYQRLTSYLLRATCRAQELAQLLLIVERSIFRCGKRNLSDNTDGRGQSSRFPGRPRYGPSSLPSYGGVDHEADALEPLRQPVQP